MLAGSSSFKHILQNPHFIRCNATLFSGKSKRQPSRTFLSSYLIALSPVQSKSFSTSKDGANSGSPTNGNLTDDITSLSRQVRLEFLSQPPSSTDTKSNAIVAKCVFNRPKANAMGNVFVQQLSECLEHLEQCHNLKVSDNTAPRVVIFASQVPGVFSAGADLKERAQMKSLEEVKLFVHSSLRLTMQRIADLSMPTIACLDGVALGGGLELAMATDIRVASTHGGSSIANKPVMLGLPETSLAIIPGAGGTQRLVQYVGIARAKELVFTGRRITAQEAFDYGLVQHLVKSCVDSDIDNKESIDINSETAHRTAEDFALELAWRMAKNGPVALRAAKAALQRGVFAKDWIEALEIERECYAKTLPTKDRLEGLAAFKEKRPPEYKGE